ncbi:MAG TPA: lmo0937 family membrane protein [Syntrophales bacterium]|nr:lmo0937 family membrane protein [Syntrophales bacterium]
MLRIATAILIILWLLGLATGLTLSSFIHVLPVLAIVIELIRIDESEDDAFAAGPKTEE